MKIDRRFNIWNSENRVCYLCGKYVSLENMTIDHVIAKSKGGSNKLENLKPTHKICNNIKSNN